jgi:NADH-quinone oxidoreductase subunit I
MLKALTAIVSGFISIFKGLRVTGRNMLRPAVTMEYPLEKPVMTSRFRGLVDLYPEKCIACAQCVKICPTAALDLTVVTHPETRKRVPGNFTYNEELCCYCGLCAGVCPTAAMVMNSAYVVSYFSHQDMTKVDLMRTDKYQHITPPKMKERRK